MMQKVDAFLTLYCEYNWSYNCPSFTASMVARITYDEVTCEWTLTIMGDRAGGTTDIWTGTRSDSGAHPEGIYTRVSGCDPTATYEVLTP